MPVEFFTKDPFQVEYNGVTHKLTDFECFGIVVVGIVSIPLMLVGSFFLSLTLSQYLRNKKVEQLQAAQLNNTDTKIDSVVVKSEAPIGEKQVAQPLTARKKEMPQTALEQLNEWYFKDSSSSLGFLDKKVANLGNLSNYEVKVIFDALNAVGRDLKNKSDGELFSLRQDERKILVDLKIKSVLNDNGVVKLKIGATSVSLAKDDFIKLFVGYVLSLEESFFAVVYSLGRGGLVVYPNSSFTFDNSDLVGDFRMDIMTREGTMRALGTQWQVGADSVCRRVV